MLKYTSAALGQGVHFLVSGATWVWFFGTAWEFIPSQMNNAMIQICTRSFSKALQDSGKR